jgi:hypothetical protein
MLQAIHAKLRPRKQMSDMSPLQGLLLRLLRSATLGAAALLVIFFGLNPWQETQAHGFWQFTRQDWSFVGLLAFVLVYAVLLYRAISREMSNPGT